ARQAQRSSGAQACRDLLLQGASPLNVKRLEIASWLMRVVDPRENPVSDAAQSVLSSRLWTSVDFAGERPAALSIPLRGYRWRRRQAWQALRVDPARRPEGQERSPAYRPSVAAPLD